MTWEIAFVLGLLVIAVAMFVWERVSPDVTAIALFGVLLVSGIVPRERVLGVLANPAPLTIGAMFILSAALAGSGAMERLANALGRVSNFSYFSVTLLLTLGVGVVSAFMNNTPVVVVTVPVVLGLATRMKLPPSKFLIPISYAAVLGGLCTLIGTSTNLVVSGIAASRGLPPLGMFELANVGVPMLAAGALYIAVFGWRILPSRESLGALFTEDERREYVTEVFVQPDTEAIGRSLADLKLTPGKGIRVVEFIRNDVPIPFDPKGTALCAGDRLVLACRPKGVAHARSIAGIETATDLALPLHQITAHEGSMVEAVVGPNSELIGRTIREVGFRERYRMIALAVHRRGQNVREKVEDVPLHFGDILLLMGTDQAIENTRAGHDLLLIDRPPVPSKRSPRHLVIVLAAILSVIVASSLKLLPIEVASILACAVVLLTGCIKPKDAYRTIELNVIFLIYGMLALGVAMEETGTSAYLVDHLAAAVDAWAPPAHKAMIMLAAFYLTATILTEILSNTAVAALMVPLAISLAGKMGVNPQPFMIAICVAASAAFATPIGYQTNTYVYGIGGYKFADFLKFGLPLNVICFAIAIYLIPIFWQF